MKNSRHLVDPQLLEFFDNFPDLNLDDSTIEDARELSSSMVITLEEFPQGVTREDIFIPGHKGSPAVRALLYQSNAANKTEAAYLQIHGGGMVMGTPEGSEIVNVGLCAELGITVLSVDYRLAPENPYPAALYDCYAGLEYLHQQSKTLGIHPQQIAIGGESAGGGLAASLAIYARNLGQYNICHQHLVFPMIDHRTGLGQLREAEYLGEYCWLPESNRYGWTSYLGDYDVGKAIIPALEKDLTGLPPAWIGVGDLDLFLPENQLYAERLIAADVNVEFAIYEGAPHGFMYVQEADVTKKYTADFKKALKVGLSVA